MKTNLWLTVLTIALVLNAVMMRTNVEGDACTAGIREEHFSATLIEDAITPAGVIVATASSTAPSGWLLCDGSTVLESAYPELFSAISTNYNNGTEGTGYFRLPDLRGRVTVGLDADDVNISDGYADSLGDTSGGEDKHTLSVAEMPAHTHTYNDRQEGALGGGYPGRSAGSATTSSTGGNTSHNNVQPYLTVNYIIKY